MNPIGTRRRLVLLVCLILSHGSASAQSLSNLAGSWNTLLFSTPGALTLERNQNGQVTNVGGPALTLYVNATKDVMLGVDLQEAGNRQELLVFVKVPAMVGVAELAGVWKLNTFQTPSQLTLERDGLGNVTNVREAQEFYIARQKIVVGNDGYMVGRIPEAATGMLVPGAGGSIAVTVDKPGQPPQNLTLHLNAGKNLMTGLITSANGQEFLVLTRAPDVPGTVDFIG